MQQLAGNIEVIVRCRELSISIALGVTWFLLIRAAGEAVFTAISGRVISTAVYLAALFSVQAIGGALVAYVCRKAPVSLAFVVVAVCLVMVGVERFYLNTYWAIEFGVYSLAIVVGDVVVSLLVFFVSYFWLRCKHGGDDA